MLTFHPVYVITHLVGDTRDKPPGSQRVLDYPVSWQDPSSIVG